MAESLQAMVAAIACSHPLRMADAAHPFALPLWEYAL